MTALVVLAVVLVVLGAVAVWQRRRAGVLFVVAARDQTPDAELAAELAAAGLTGAGPLVLHFSAEWCGPCAQVRPLVERVCTELGGVRHLEVDVSEHPALVRRCGVLSLPTVLILDEQLATRARVSGVPLAADLRTALVPLIGSGGSDHPDAR